MAVKEENVRTFKEYIDEVLPEFKQSIAKNDLCQLKMRLELKDYVVDNTLNLCGADVTDVKRFKDAVEKWFGEILDEYEDLLVNGPACKEYIWFVIDFSTEILGHIGTCIIDNDCEADWFFVNVLEVGDLWE